jgi:hypothetical protein
VRRKERERVRNRDLGQSSCDLEEGREGNDSVREFEMEEGLKGNDHEREWH